MKENRQGCLSRPVKPTFAYFLKYAKVWQLAEKDFFDKLEQLRFLMETELFFVVLQE